MKRQGDLLIVKVDAIPQEAMPIASRILAEGEATGHKHELDEGQVYQEGETLYFRVKEGDSATLKHEEHAPLFFEQGEYKVIRQREYTPTGWHNVQD